jgi:hypothetical protein
MLPLTSRIVETVVPEQCRLIGVRRNQQGTRQDDQRKARRTSAPQMPDGAFLSVLCRDSADLTEAEACA